MPSLTSGALELLTQKFVYCLQGCAQSACFEVETFFLDTALNAPKKKKKPSLSTAGPVRSDVMNWMWARGGLWQGTESGTNLKK